MTTASPETPEGKPNRAVLFIKSWLPFALILAVVYFGNVELQSYLGREALKNTGLPMLSLDEALKKASEEDKLVLADMSAIWCSSCRKLDNEVLSNEEVQRAINDKYVFARIEYESEEGEEFMKIYHVSGFPTLLVLNSQGDSLKQLQITYNPIQFVSQL